MGAGLTNSTSLNDLVGSIVDEMVQEYSYALRVVRPLIRYKECPQGAASVVIPRFGAVSVAALTQATAPTAEQLTSTGVTLTPTERGVLITISKQTLYQDPFSDLEPYARSLSKALAEDEDSVQLAAMAASGTTGFSNIVNNGAGASDMTLAHFRSAIGRLISQNAPFPYFCVMHGVSWAKIMDDLDDAAKFALPGIDVVQGHGRGYPVAPDGFVAAPYGVPIYLSSKVDTTVDTNETISNVMFSQESWGYSTTFDHRVDTQEQVKERAFDCIAWYAGHGAELVDTYGTIIEDSLNP